MRTLSISGKQQDVSGLDMGRKATDVHVGDFVCVIAALESPVIDRAICAVLFEPGNWERSVAAL